MQATALDTSEVAIFSRIPEPEQATLSIAAAEAILELGFRQDDKHQMAELLAKAKAGKISPEEQAAMNNYEKVGHLLALMKSKARRSIKQQNPTNGVKAL